MAPVDRPISEAELQAFVDGRLEAERGREVEVYLAGQPVVASRVAAYRAQRDDLRQALADLATDPIPPELNLSRLYETRQRRRFGLWRVAAAVLVALAIGGAGGWYAATAGKLSRNEQAMAVLRQQALASHAVYAVDRSHPVEIGAEQRDHLALWLSNRLHRTVVPPDLEQAGFHLLGGRLLATERGGAAALFVYADAQGARIAVLMRPMAPDMQAARADMNEGTVNGCAWIAKSMGYAVVGTAPDAVLDRVAVAIIRQTAQG